MESVQPVTLVYPCAGFANRYAVNVDHGRQEYQVVWDGDWRVPPDYNRFSELDSAATTLIPHSPGLSELWGRSHVIGCGADAHVRILYDRDGDAFPVFKVANDKRQRQLLRDEFRILSYLSSKKALVTVRISPEPLADDQGIFAFGMEELFEINRESYGSYTLQLQDAVREIHGYQIVHFDLSPSNLMRD